MAIDFLRGLARQLYDILNVFPRYRGTHDGGMVFPRDMECRFECFIVFGRHAVGHRVDALVVLSTLLLA